MSQTPMPDLAAIKARHQQTWATGDFAVVGSHITIVAEQLCEAVDLRAGWEVLDVATGSGNTALAAARRFCEVTGVDFVPALLERGRERPRRSGCRSRSWRATPRPCPSQTPPSTRSCRPSA